MTSITFKGHSDDIVSYTIDYGGKSTSDELYGGESVDPLGVTVWSLLVSWSTGRAQVFAVYSGCWSFALSKVDEDDPPLPSLTRSWEGYSEKLELAGLTGTIKVAQQKWADQWKHSRSHDCVGY